MIGRKQEIDKRESILIVDDDGGTCRSLTLLFGKNGYETEAVGTGREAIEKAQERFFDVALLDIKLPDMEGVELIAPLKKMYPDMEVIMVTAYASLQTAVRALNEGASIYITKPFNMDEVLARVREVLEKQRLMIENRKLYQATQRELAKRKKMERVLKESEREWRKILNSLDDLVLLIDTKYNILQANKSVMELVKKPEKEIIGQKCYKVLHRRNEPMANCPLVRFLETGNMETLNYHEPVFDKHFSVKTTPTLGKKNKTMEFIDVLRDTTEQKKAEEQAKKSYEDMVLSMAIALEARDPYTRGHSDRVKRYCRAIAHQMGLPAKQIQELERAASLHDIGKIAIPDAILSKSGGLTPPEFAQVQLHPEKSVDLIRLIPNPEDTLLAIRHHHERVNGKGYPDGLSGDNLPLEARILAVADAYDALTSERPYRKSFTHEEALQILKENAGTQWDAKVVEASIEALSEKK